MIGPHIGAIFLPFLPILPSINLLVQKLSVTAQFGTAHFGNVLFGTAHFSTTLYGTAHFGNAHFMVIVFAHHFVLLLHH